MDKLSSLLMTSNVPYTLSKMQLAADQIAAWFHHNFMNINTKKTKGNIFWSHIAKIPQTEIVLNTLAGLTLNA